MILLHLSDLHFDIRDPLELMYSKWDSMIECIIKRTHIDALILSGDMIFYQHIDENFEYAAYFLNLLISRLGISRKNVFLCAGNHEMKLLKGCPQEVCGQLMRMSKEQKETYTASYRHFYEHICMRPYPETALCEGIETDEVSLLVIDSFASIDSMRKCYFVPMCKTVSAQMHRLFSVQGRTNLIIQHAESQYVCRQCIDSIPYEQYGAITLCGHKNFKLKTGFFPAGCNANLVSGAKDGFVEDTLTYGIYNVTRDGVWSYALNYEGGCWKIKV